VSVLLAAAGLGASYQLLKLPRPRMLQPRSLRPPQAVMVPMQSSISARRIAGGVRQSYKRAELIPAAASRFPGHMRSPFSFTAGPLPPVVACTSSDGKPWRALPSHMDARTPADDQVPAWIADAALRQHHVVSKDSKCAFNLLPERVRRASAVVLLDLASSPWR